MLLPYTKRIPFRLVYMFTVILLRSMPLYSQCSTGQTPATAFPICGTTSFLMNTVPACGGKYLPVPGCSAIGYQDVNAYWYKFTCYTTGTLGMVIAPLLSTDDYDWQLFDITGRKPDDVYSNSSLIVTGNWAGPGINGQTGTSSTGVSKIQCFSAPGAVDPTFAIMPTIIQGHEYLLMVSHFTTTNQSGYHLSFGGGTASITNNVQPHLQSVSYNCSTRQVYLKLSKKVFCNSLALNGTDFIIDNGAATITAASGANCTGAFDMDSVVMQLNAPLPAGTHTVAVKTGTDNNTLLDYCQTAMPDGEALTLTVPPTPYIEIDSLSKITCAPNSIQVYFNQPIDCNTIAANGSDFVITGPAPVTIASLTSNCTAGATTNTITLYLSQGLVTGGNYQLSLKTGTDGNSLLSQCGQGPAPAYNGIGFSASDTVSALFTYQLVQHCGPDTLRLSHAGNNGVTEWLWQLDVNAGSTLQQVEHMYTTPGIKNISLIVSNGVCKDTAAIQLSISEEPSASFTTVTDTLCPNDVAVFTNTSSGVISHYLWNFGNGTTSTLRDVPALQYPPAQTREQLYTVQLVVWNASNCYDTAQRILHVFNSCYLAVPSAFTPNGDGLNDFLYPLNGFTAAALDFKVFNRYGQQVFHGTDASSKWDGRFKNVPQPPGTYVWMFRYVTRTGKTEQLQGSTVLIR